MAFYYLKYGTGQRSGLSIDSPKSSEDEEEDDDDPIQEPPRAKWDFFKPFGGARPSKDVKSGEELEEEDDNGVKDEEEGEEGEDSWIVEDDGPEGVPELPVAFNMSSHQDLSHHFKIVCQLFVHLVVRSPSQRASFIQDVKAGEHLNISPKPLFHVEYNVYCPMGFRLLQPKMNISMRPCRRSGGR